MRIPNIVSTFILASALSLNVDTLYARPAGLNYSLRPHMRFESESEDIVEKAGMSPSSYSLTETIQKAIRTTNFPWPFYIFGSAATYGVRNGSDIDIAVPMRTAEGQKLNVLIVEARTFLSPNGVFHWGPVMRDRIELWHFILRHKDGNSAVIDPFLKPANKFVFRITQNEIQIFSQEDKIDLLKQAFLDCQRYIFSKPEFSEFTEYIKEHLVPELKQGGLYKALIKKQRLETLFRSFPDEDAFEDIKKTYLNDVEYVGPNGREAPPLLVKDDLRFYNVDGNFALIHKNMTENDVIASACPFYGCINITIKGEKNGRAVLVFIHTVSLNKHIMKKLDRIDIENPYVFFDILDIGHKEGKKDRDAIIKMIKSSTQAVYPVIYKAKLKGTILIHRSGNMERATKIIADKNGIALKLIGQGKPIVSLLYEEIRPMPLEISANLITKFLHNFSRICL